MARGKVTDSGKRRSGKVVMGHGAVEARTRKLGKVEVGN